MPPPIPKSSIVTVQPTPSNVTSSSPITKQPRYTRSPDCTQLQGSFCGRTVSSKCVIVSGTIASGLFCVGATTAGLAISIANQFVLGVSVPFVAGAAIIGGADIYAMTERVTYLNVSDCLAERKAKTKVTPEHSIAEETNY